MTVTTPCNPTQQPAAQPSSSAGAVRTKKLIVLGSTGSIGVNTLDVVRHLNETGAAKIEVVGLAAGRNVEALIEQARAFDVPALAISDEAQAPALRAALPRTKLFIGPDASLKLVEAVDATDLSAAIVGSAGLSATIAGIKKGMRIGLANKETLVAAGAIVSPLVRQHGVTMIPVDSEHSAIFQCLQGASDSPPSQGGAGGGSGAQHSEDLMMHGGSQRGVRSTLPPPLPKREGSQTLRPPSVKRIVLTASGGPFRTASKETIENATVEQALKHPTWNMGPKITIDSATMMNKALEIIEAHWLFDLPGEKISVIVHPQSIIHSFVEFEDNSVLAQLGPPDMRTPIQYALTYPDRPPGCSKALDWSILKTLDFEQPDFERFRSLKLAYDVIEAGGTAGAVFNAANEAAVAAFLNRRIRFGRIVELVAEALSAIAPQPADSLDTLWEADRAARAFVEQRAQ
ncbi:MAG: 1-deoxy-D-xylulose-5-phosphate reductoisomerase [Phycisphaeraceae bacterium]